MRIIISLFLAFILIACGNNSNNYEFSSIEEKEFYTDSEGMDYFRFPLISPYEAICIDNDEWIINLKIINNNYFSIGKVKKIFGNDSIVCIYSSSDHIRTIGQDVWQWFIIIPSSKIEIGFSSEEEFKKYLAKSEIYEINWVEVNEVYKRFRKTECLPWIPGCSNKK